jgi:hypothetical protein
LLLLFAAAAAAAAAVATAAVAAATALNLPICHVEVLHDILVQTEDKVTQTRYAQFLIATEASMQVQGIQTAFLLQIQYSNESCAASPASTRFCLRATGSAVNYLWSVAGLTMQSSKFSVWRGLPRQRVANAAAGMGQLQPHMPRVVNSMRQLHALFSPSSSQVQRRRSLLR